MLYIKGYRRNIGLLLATDAHALLLIFALSPVFLFGITGCAKENETNRIRHPIEYIADKASQVADSLFISGNLEGAFLAYAQLRPDSIQSYAWAKMAEISYVRNELYGLGELHMPSPDEPVDSSRVSLFYEIGRFFKGQSFRISVLMDFINTSVSTSDDMQLMRLSWVHRVLGEYYKERVFKVDSAIHHFQEADQLQNGIVSSSFEKFWIYKKLSDLHMLDRQNLKALHYANQLIALSKHIHDPDHLHFGMALATKGYLMFRFELYSQTDSLISKMIGLFPEHACNKVYAFGLEGLAVSKIKQRDSAGWLAVVDLFEGFEQTCGKGILNRDRWQAQYFYSMGDYPNAIPYFKRSVAYCLQEKRLDIPVFDNQCLLLAESLLSEGNFPESLRYLASGEERMVIDTFIPEEYLQSSFNQHFSFVTYIRFGQVYLDWYRRIGQDKFLDYATLFFEMAGKMSQAYPKDMYEEEFLLFLRNMEDLHGLGMELAYERGLLAGSSKVKQEFYTHAENNRAAMFWKYFRTSDVNNALNPLFKRERQLQTLAIQERINGFPNSELLGPIVSELESIRKKLRGNYAEEYEKILAIESPSLLATCEYLLGGDSSSLLILDHVGDRLYVQFINREKYHVYHIPFGSELEELLIRIQEASSGVSEIQASEFEQISHRLFQSIFPDSIADMISGKVYFIHDPGWFHFNPEVLCTKRNSAESYTQLELLVHRTDFIHAASVKELIRKLRPEVGKETGIGKNIAFYFSDGRTMEKHCRPFPELPGSLREVRHLKGFDRRAELWGGERATKKAFLRVFGRKRIGILHLGLHGKAENQLRDDVRLYFSKQKCGIDTLFGYELLAMHSDIDLVILSSCESGAGKEVIGEGVFSLPRYFSVSGSRAIISSQWSVSDRFSSAFFRRFYHYLTTSNFIEAYFRSKREMARSETFCHPKYWSCFRYYM